MNDFRRFQVLFFAKISRDILPRIRLEKLPRLIRYEAEDTLIEEAGQTRSPRNNSIPVYRKKFPFQQIDGGNIRWKDFPRFDG